MAEGALRASRAEVAVSVTGIAGPDGGTAAKPVGLVHFACARRGKPTVAREERFGDIGREAVRLASVRVGLDLLEAALQPLIQVHLVEWNERGSKSFTKRWANDFGDETDERYGQDSVCSPSRLRIRRNGARGDGFGSDHSGCASRRRI